MDTPSYARRLLNLLIAFGVMVALLLLAAVAGGVGSMELTLWGVLTAAVLILVAVGSSGRDALVRALARAARFRRHRQHANS